ncbi:MAG: hypothetical protein RML72_10085 [Bacteroidia bacterium]|nr:hypothetical protein [Bacteroidia bacterium]MDW8159206.1 hypothetical protein [Bacteroidia bacterium]
MLLLCKSSIAQYNSSIANITWHKEKVVSYGLKDTNHKVILFLEYAKATILNPEAWNLEQRKGKKVYKIELVYTGYPRDTNDWLTPFGQLLRRRVESLLQLAPELGQKSSTIDWVLVEQTGCSTAKIAKTYFHGFVLHYLLENISPAPEVLALSLSSPPDLLQNFEESEEAEEDTELPKRKKNKKSSSYRQKKRSSYASYVSEYVTTNMKVVYEILDTTNIETPLPGPADTVNNAIDAFMVRRPEIKNALVVIDWTGSMYPYGAQIIKWHHQNLEQQLIRAIVLTNDGDGFREFYRFLTSEGGSKWGTHILGSSSNEAYLHFLEKRRNVIGNRGGIYFTDTLEIENLLRLMEKAMQNGCGDEIPENNIETLLAATKKYPDFENILHIADNNAPVVDMALLDSLKHPIHVILCGKKNAPFQVDYLKIAAHTGGSVTTIESELDFGTSESIQFKQYPNASGIASQSTESNIFELFCELEKSYRIAGVESPYFCALQAARQKYSSQIIGKTISTFLSLPKSSDITALGIQAEEVAAIDSLFVHPLPYSSFIGDCTFNGIPYTIYFLKKFFSSCSSITNFVAFNGGDNFRRALLSSEKEAHEYLGYFNKITSFFDRRPLKSQTPKVRYLPQKGVYIFQNLVNIQALEKAMQKVALGGTGIGNKKNILEVILELQKQTNIDTLLLVIDKQAEICDWYLLPYLQKPVHILACGPKQVPTSADLITLAYTTRGKLISSFVNINFQEARWHNSTTLLFDFQIYTQTPNGRFRLERAKPEVYIQKFIEQRAPVSYAQLLDFFERITPPNMHENQRKKVLKEILNRLIKQKLIQKTGSGNRTLYSMGIST